MKKEMKLLKALNDIDEQYLLETETYKGIQQSDSNDQLNGCWWQL